MTICPRRAFALSCALFLPLVPAMAAPTPTDGCSVTIHVTGFRNAKGKLGVELFTNPAGWPEVVDKSFRHAAFPIDGDHATARFSNIPPGKYGIVVLHDENENEKLDRNILAVPKEGFGFANNPHVLLQAPAFEKATVPVACPATTTNIRLIYK